MKDLEYFLEYELKEDVMDVIIYLPDGRLLDSPEYSNYIVLDVRYEEREDGKYCLIKVELNLLEENKYIN